MKSEKVFKRATMILSLSIMTFVLLFSACKEDDPIKPAPTLTLTATEGSGIAGAAVTTSVTVEAPEGGLSLEILVNGVADAALPNKTLTGSTSETVDISYTIPANAAVGSITNITFKATDKKNQSSAIANYKITVTEVPAKPIVEVSGTLTGNIHWTADKIYRLSGFVRIGEDVKPAPGGPGVTPVIGATGVLTIDAGTVIYGKVGTPGGALIIQRGSKIMAEGTATNPIIFTSEKAVGTKKAGDWSGVVICGKAANNIKASASTGVDGIEELEGAYGGFHGGGATADNGDNSGILKYVRIEFAGYPINPNQELNGLTFGSVGSGTVVDFVQVTYANDDSFEFFGGEVSPKHLIAYKGIDDDFDTDNGFSGKVQFGLAIRDANIADQSGSNGFECDNDAAGSANLPFTDATFSNMTIVGGKQTKLSTLDLSFQNGAQIRRNAKQDIINSLITAFPNGIYIDNALGIPGTIGNAISGDLAFKNNILAGVEGWGGNGFGSAATADEKTVLTLEAVGSNHPNAPRGRVVAGGVGSFSNGVFSYSTQSGASTNFGELQIGGVSPILWFSASNTILARWSDSGLNANVFDPLSGTPTLTPTAGSPLTSGASFTGYTGFENVTYRGAFGTTDWTTGWVNWNPQITDYSK